MLILFNLRGLAMLGAGAAAWVAVTAATERVFVGVVVGAVVAVTLDVVDRRRAGRGLFAVDAGGMVCLLPVWLVALAGLLAATLVATALPPGWDRPPPVAGDAAP